MHEKRQRSRIIPQPAVFDKVLTAGIAEQLHPHGGCNTFQSDPAGVADGISADSTADVVGQLTGRDGFLAHIIL